MPLQHSMGSSPVLNDGLFLMFHVFEVILKQCFHSVAVAVFGTQLVLVECLFANFTKKTIFGGLTQAILVTWSAHLSWILLSRGGHLEYWPCWGLQCQEFCPVNWFTLVPIRSELRWRWLHFIAWCWQITVVSHPYRSLGYYGSLANLQFNLLLDATLWPHWLLDHIIRLKAAMALVFLMLSTVGKSVIVMGSGNVFPGLGYFRTVYAV